jgi:hypothetical protein
MVTMMIFMGDIDKYNKIYINESLTNSRWQKQSFGATVHE